MYEDVTGMELTYQNRDVELQELPLRVVPDWDIQVRHADEICRLIDRHLDYEADRCWLTDHRSYRPRDLCPEQRVQMITDIHAVTSSGRARKL